MVKVIGFYIITYNFINLPKVLTKDANNSITYYYDALEQN